MTLKPGDFVSARALPCDGGALAFGSVLDVRGGLVLLDLPHGRWCELEGAQRVKRPRKLRNKCIATHDTAGSSKNGRDFFSLNEGRPLAP